MTNGDHKAGAREVALLKKKAFEVSVYLENLGFRASDFPEVHESLDEIDKHLDTIYERIR